MIKWHLSALSFMKLFSNHISGERESNSKSSMRVFKLFQKALKVVRVRKNNSSIQELKNVLNFILLHLSFRYSYTIG